MEAYNHQIDTITNGRMQSPNITPHTSIMARPNQNLRREREREQAPLLEREEGVDRRWCTHEGHEGHIGTETRGRTGGWQAEGGGADRHEGWRGPAAALDAWIWRAEEGQTLESPGATRESGTGCDGCVEERG